MTAGSIRRPRAWLQFVGYAVCGGIATGVDVVVFYALAWRIIPALGADDPLVRLLNLAGPFAEEAVRSRHFLINRAIAFFFSNLAAYALNARFIFRPGRHGKHKEMMLFFVLSLTSVGIGTTVGWTLIRFAGWSTTVSYICNIIAAVLINYAGRKYWVFDG